LHTGLKVIIRASLFREENMDFTPKLADVLHSAKPLIEAAITEDIGPGDATTRAVLPPRTQAKAMIQAKADGILAGLPVAKAVFQRLDPSVDFLPVVNDGVVLKPRTACAYLQGPAAAILAGERIALNFLQHLSGIATLTSAYVHAVNGTRAVILDTRKTTPGYRMLEKYAVRIGGGKNHRLGLFDMMLVKDNHIQAAGSLSMAVRRARDTRPNLQLEVEVTTLAQLEEAISLSVDRILLDNMDLETIRKAVAITRNRIRLEVSGGVTLETVREIAATGVDFISVGALTHSAPALDISLEIAAQ
jgi:nicotinate-nucleotide pyrophosphorylase (carboxylating)